MKKILSILIILGLLAGNFSAYAEEPLPEEPVAEVTAEPTAPVYTLLKGGSKGEEVKALQERLIELGYLDGTADGDYGEKTKKAVRTFQRSAGLDVDGLAGKDTQTLLFSEDAPTAPEPTGPIDVLAYDKPMLVNKEYTVDEDFEPADLVNLKEYCAKAPVKIKYKNIMAVQVAADALIEMLNAAKADGITNWQISAAYRSYSQQNSLLNSKINSYMEKNPSWSRSKARKSALRTVALPGASEHHLGLAFDINVPGTSAFLGTKQCTWLHAHCWDYGFIVRYPEGKESITGFTAEAWHIRYVGTEHSLIMKETGECLEEYLEAEEE